MTPREKNLLVILSVTVGLALLLGAGYFGFYAPWSEKKAQVQQLELSIAEKQRKLLKLANDLPKIKATLSKGLPADPDIARQEYDAALSKMLRDAKVPSSSWSIKPRAVDSKVGIPELEKGKLAFQKVSFEITMEKVSYAAIIDVLTRYYNMNLLHQITKFNIKKSQDSGISRIGSALADRADLNCTIHTEAIILDGAENRPTLYPVPPGAGLLGGGAGLQAIYATPQVGRQFRPAQLGSALAYADRNYTLMLVRDIFHGSPPPPPPPPPPPRVEEEPPKEDTSAFIRLTGLGRNSDGTGSAVIEDVASKHEYTITMMLRDGKLTAETSKVYFLKGNRKKIAMDGPPGTLEISDESSSTMKKFRVLGLDEDHLILAGIDTPPPAKSSSKNGFGSPPSRPTSVRAPAATALTGPFLMTLPVDKLYAWKHGDPLSKVKELTKDEAAKALQRVLTSSPAASGPPTPPSKGL